MKYQFTVGKYPVKVVENGKVLTFDKKGESYRKCGICGYIKSKKEFETISPVFDYYVCKCCSILTKEQQKELMEKQKKQCRYSTVHEEVSLYNSVCEYQTVSEVIKMLEKLPPDARIYKSYHDSDEGEQIMELNEPEEAEFSFNTEVKIFKV